MQLAPESIVEINEIAKVKGWFETNKDVLEVYKTNPSYREFSKDLILPFFDKEPDWSNFSEYFFPDGRKVFEVNIKDLSGIVPVDFFEKYGSSSSELVEEALLFVEHTNSEIGYSIWVARYFSYGKKSDGMTYHVIPSDWSGRIDLFTFSEVHLKSFEVEDGLIVKTLEYKTEDPSKRMATENMLMTCTGSWIDYPYYGSGGGVASTQSTFVISCHNPIDLSGGSGGANWPTHPNPSGPSGGGSGGGGTGSGAFGSTGGGSGTSNGVCDHTNNFASDCIPSPENYWESLDYFLEVLATLTQLQWVSDPIVKDYKDLNNSEKLLHILNHLKFNTDKELNFKINQIMTNVPRIAPPGPYKPSGGWYESQTAALKINNQTYYIGYVFGNQDGFNYINVKRGYDRKYIEDKNQINIYFYDVNFPGRTALEIYLPKELESWFDSLFKM
ncbi:hypothetical protein [Mongoliitalea lutea]|uniref:Uncharacterized protein n=1 Tax=Mongoliitalea lutea TaxID=849756 RepID=A0A8J3CWS9_9BACT|nr:hypothetical protein [Mongoliitalea lutea]GHB34837.1 hypothetical protein GCM10008106_15200 [Mongoliitalea lutea]